MPVLRNEKPERVRGPLERYTKQHQLIELCLTSFNDAVLPQEARGSSSSRGLFGPIEDVSMTINTSKLWAGPPINKGRRRELA
jgi:hypothetical protein